MLSISGRLLIYDKIKVRVTSEANFDVLNIKSVYKRVCDISPKMQ